LTLFFDTTTSPKVSSTSPTTSLTT
jgi:hypothetical protein